MALSDVGSQSFEFYEGIRIIIPGALIVGLVDALQWTLDPKHGLSIDTATAVVAAIAFGLLAYFVDLPRQSAFFNRDLPSDLMRKYYDEHLANTESDDVQVDHRNAFFVIADELMPAPIRARGL